MKKFFTILLIFIACLMISLDRLKTHYPQNKTVIKFSSWGSQSETELLRPLIKTFEKENPDIIVEFVHIPQNYFQKLHLLFASNLAPDVVFINNYYAPKYVKADLLEDLTPYVNKEEYFDKALDGFTFQNKIYAVPRDVSDLVIFYNKDLFKKYNVPYPNPNWNLNDYLNTSQSFKDKGVWGTSYETDVIFWLPYLMSNGSGVLNHDGKKIIIDDKTALSSLDFYSSLANKYSAAPKKSDSASLTMAQMFLRQKIAMHLSGRWLVPKYRKEADFDWDIVTFPKGSSGSVVNIDSSGYAMSKSSKHKKEALKFIQYISSSKSLSALTKSGLIVPARKDIAYSKDFLKDNQKPHNSIAFLDAIKSGKPTPVNENYQKITDKLNTALEPVFLGKKRAREAITPKLLIDISRYAY